MTCVHADDHEYVRDSLLQPCLPPATTLGRLDRLPIELLREICLYLDIDSLFGLRHVNRRASQVVGALRFYRVMVQHSLEALCILLKTEAAASFTLGEFAEVLHTENCRLCGSFRGFVFLPSLTRCCFSCMEFAPDCSVIDLLIGITFQSLSCRAIQASENSRLGAKRRPS